jgi:myo-inositol-1(or 4)-monophosphatase
LPESDLALLIRTARDAGEIALGFWRTDQTVWHKDEGAGPVSEGDYATDTALRNALTTARPGYGWLSEETPDDAARLSCDRAFVVDPIDGTRAYVDGQDTWALSLAVVSGGAPVAAVVYLPARGTLYAAATLLAPRPSLDPEHWPGGVPPVTRAFRPSLAWRLALVAEGAFDAMLTFRDAWEWDIAAGALIAAEAGARVTDRAGAPLAFNSPAARTPGALVAPPPLHAALLARR